MNEIFLKAINMSISASWLVLAVLVLRLLLKKAPKWVSVLLWGIVAVRLLCPFSIESALSLIPSAHTVPVGIEMDATPAIDSGIIAINSVVNPVISASFTPHHAASANPLQIWIPVASILWVAGMVIMLLYTAVSYWQLRYKVRTAVLFRDNIFQSEHVGSPFVLGIVRPKIYLPFKMDDKDLELVIAHEQAHIRRKDHWWKPLGFLLLAIHWFNPLVWLGYVLLCRDIELACDEKVIKELDNAQKADYTQALLVCSIGRKRIAACPLAFGEVGVKERVRSVMNYKKPAFWFVILAVIICIAVAVCFLTDPIDNAFDVLEDKDDIIGTVSAADDMQRIRTQNGDVLILENNGEPWQFYEGQEIPVEIAFVNDGSSMSMKSVGYIYCGDGEEGLYANEIFSNQTVNSASGSFTAPESGNYLFYFRNYSSSWIELKSFVLGCRFEAEILEIHDGYFLVEPVPGSTELRSADRIEIPMKNMEPSPEPQVGDILEIRYNGMLQETYPAMIGEVYSIRVRQEKPTLSLNDVIILSQKGYELSWADFEEYNYIETGSGLYIRMYEINSRFSLGIGGAGPNSKPMYIYLTEEDGPRIDIRDGGVTEFISQHNGEPVEEVWDLIPMVMVDGQLYLTTGYESTVEGRCGVMDGEITSAVDGSEKPTKDNQSNFGTGYSYQYGATEGTIEIYMNGKWWIYATEEARKEIQFPTLDDKERYTPKGVSGENVTELSAEPENVNWQDGVVFQTLAPREVTVSSFEIVVEEDNSTLLLSIGWARPGLYLEYGIRSEDGTAYFQEKAGGHSRLLIENIPAGTYRLYVENSDAYKGLPSYEDPQLREEVGYNADGVMLYALK